MLNITNLDVRYGEKHLFNNVSARINERDRIGLIGVNGAGKTTLLRMICGESETDPGVVSRPRYATIAYLPQEIAAIAGERTIYQEAETAFAEALSLQDELTTIHRQLGSLDPSAAEFAVLLKRQGELQHRLDTFDIFKAQAEIEKILMGLGFKTADFDRPSRTLSGGWLMRLQLAKLLLAKPSLLLLDEPTNHLDLDSLTWLENFLQAFEGGLVIISHDRAFLDRTTGITWELSRGRITAYKGNYSFYIAEKEVRLQVERASYENQQAQIRQTMRFVQRFRAKSTKAKQVQSRLKQLGKIERIELSETERGVKFRFPPADPSGKLVVEVSGLSRNFAGRQVFGGLSFHLQRGDKVAVVGVNGAGKTTLMKLLAGLDTPDAGSIHLGHNVRLSYFGQHQAQELSPELTVLDTLANSGQDLSNTECRSLLGAFLFQGEEVDKKVMVLSGGEKSRLALAKMIVQPANLLVLDEPTNHLDISSQEVLQEAMSQYDGTVVIVSHNRYFVNGFINKVLEIRDGNGTFYEGNIDDFLRKRQQEDQVPAVGSGTGKSPLPAVAGSDKSTAAAEAGSSLNRKAVRQEQARIRQEKARRLAPHKKVASETEIEIEQLEKAKKDLEKKMADPELYKDEAVFAGCSRDYHGVERRLERQLHRWEEAQSAIEAVEAEYDRLLAAVSE